MLFPRISLLIYVGLAVSTTFALPAPYLPADEVATSTLPEDPTPISRSTDLVSRWFDDMNLSRRHPQSTICDIREPGCLAPSKETLVPAPDPSPTGKPAIRCVTPVCLAANLPDPDSTGPVIDCDTQECQTLALGPLGAGLKRALDPEV